MSDKAIKKEKSAVYLGNAGLDAMRQTGKAKIGDRSAEHNNNFNLLRMLAATGVLVSHAYPISLGGAATEPLATLLKGVTLGSLLFRLFCAPMALQRRQHTRSGQKKIALPGHTGDLANGRQANWGVSEHMGKVG